MSITRNDPGTIFLAGKREIIGDLAASGAITPGMFIERYNNSGVIRWRVATAASAGVIIAQEQLAQNKTIADAYAANDLVEAANLGQGASALALIASGQNLAAGAKLEHAGDGTLRALASGIAVATALENKPTVTVLTRIRVEAL